MSAPHVAVVDIGKTNAKLALVRLSDLSEVAVVRRPNTVLDGPPYPHFDVEGHWAFILDGLARFHAQHGVAAITVTTHGAAAALLEGDGSLAAPILDYEHDGPDALAADYDALRPPFAETGSARLSAGLNLGAQLHWQLESDPTLQGRVRHVVTYPQYWGYRLTGVLGSDVTSLGCHTDLWNPHEGRFSSLPDRLGLGGKIAAPRKPGEVLGTIAADVAQRTGLPAHTPVHCGIHDSNASLLLHLLARRPPFSVVSTGTWVIAMTIGGQPVTLDPARDTLINVNAFGDPVPSARFMGGREYDMALEGADVVADDAAMASVLRAPVMLTPALVPQTGPFAGAQARWIGPEPAKGSAERAAAVGFYLGLVTARCLAQTGHQGDVFVEGPFARNTSFLWMLAAASSAPVVAMTSATGTSQGAALLVSKGHAQPAPAIPQTPAPPHIRALLEGYAQTWMAAVAQTGAQCDAPPQEGRVAGG